MKKAPSPKTGDIRLNGLNCSQSNEQWDKNKNARKPHQEEPSNSAPAMKSSSTGLPFCLEIGDGGIYFCSAVTIEQPEGRRAISGFGHCHSKVSARETNHYGVPNDKQNSPWG